MAGREHRYDMEVVAQGVANIASAIFGGISVTGTIARTATNIRAGAGSPVSGMAHAVFMLTAAPLASFVPLSALSPDAHWPRRWPSTIASSGGQSSEFQLRERLVALRKLADADTGSEKMLLKISFARSRKRGVSGR